MTRQQAGQRRPLLPLLALTLLWACASGAQRAARDELRLDTETAHKLRHAAALGRSTSALAPAAGRTVVASLLAEAVPLLLVLLGSDNAVGELDRRLVECARRAEREVNGRYFGSRPPTRAECGEEVGVDGCGRMTRAMQLGQQKLEVALRCAREVLDALWPGPYSIEQRYRYSPNSGVLETVSRQEEARLIKDGCTGELWRTIKPDLVLHADRNLLRSVLTLDFKFPCPAGNQAQWKVYGDTSAYAHRSQADVYERALGSEPFLISPQRGITR